MKIRDGDWLLMSYDAKTGRQTWALDHGDGRTTIRTDYPVDQTIDANTAARNAASDDWKGDWHRVASIPLNIFYNDLGDAMRAGDEKYLSKWLNDSDNRAWRTKNGNL